MHGKTLVIAVCALPLLYVQQAGAAEQIVQTDDDSGSAWLWLENRRDDVSRGVTATGRLIDAWLAGEAVGDYENETYLRLTFHQQAGTFSGYNSKLDIGGSLDLPGASERWRLVFESDDEDRNSLEDTVLGERKSNTSVGAVRYLQELPGNWQISHDVGLKASAPVDPYYRFGATADYSLGGDWSLGLRQRIHYYHHDGWGYNTDVVFSRPITERNIVSVDTSVRYRQDSDVTEFAQRLSLHRALAERRTLSYTLGVLGDTEFNTRINAYYAEGRYRRAIHEDWLFLEFASQILVDRDENWRPEPRVIVNLEVMFFNF